MGLRDALRGESEPEIDHYILRFRKHGSGNWSSPDIDTNAIDPDKIPDLIPEQDVRNRAEIENWPDGVYQLMGIKSNKGFTGAEWTFKLGKEDADDEPELTPTERMLERMDKRLARLEEDGIGPPEDLEGKLMHTMHAYEQGDIDEETVGASIAMYKDVSALVRQSEGDILDRIAEQKLDEDDLDAAATYALAKKQAERGGGGLLQNALEGDVNLDGDIGIKELIYLDAYHEFGDELKSLLRMQGGIQNNAVAQGDLGALINNEPDESDEADVEVDEPGQEPAPTSGADFDLAPGVEDPTADAAESAESATEQPDDQSPTPEPDAGETASQATEAVAEPDGGDATGIEALGEQVDPEAGEFPSLADATQAIQEEQEAADAPDEADADEGGED